MNDSIKKCSKKNEYVFDDETMSGIAKWIKLNNIGVSSKTVLIAYLSKGHIKSNYNGSYPLDWNDFNRIIQLIRLAPKVIEGVKILAEQNKEPEWKAIWENWDELIEKHKNGYNVFQPIFKNILEKVKKEQ